MNIKRIFLMELGMAVIGLAGILAYKRSCKEIRSDSGNTCRN